MTILAIHHSSLIVSDLEKSLHFYCDILGFEHDPGRPDLSFEGAWLKAGESQGVHLLRLPNPDPIENRTEHGGRDRHTAFFIDHYDELKKNLKVSGIEFTESQSGRAALFCRDPDGNALEFIQSTLSQS